MIKSELQIVLRRGGTFGVSVWANTIPGPAVRDADVHEISGCFVDRKHERGVSAPAALVMAGFRAK